MSSAVPGFRAAPWRFFEPHRGRPFSFFLDRGSAAAASADAVAGCEQSGASFAGSRPRQVLVIDATGRARRYDTEGEGAVVDADPFDAIASFVESATAGPRPPAPATSAILPRVVGYLSYELGFWADEALAPLRDVRLADADRTGTPLAVLSSYDSVDCWDAAAQESRRLSFSQGSARGALPRFERLPCWRATSESRYAAAFARVQEAIAAGDIYQANLSRRAVFDLDEDAASAYERYREVQPVPWGAFLDFGTFALLSNSPECFLVRDGDCLLTKPIKGTRPRRDDAAADLAIRDELRRDAKEMAEHLMIVDLERNDLGRVAETGSVEVRSFAEVESYATLHHLVSDVSATLREGIGLAELLRATFPGGSITGAPKIRAMEILREVEAAERGPYTGAIGHFESAERFELSIAIRTALAHEGRLLYQAGGGIVADSDLRREWDETEVKIAALREALASSSRQRTRNQA